MENLLKNKIVLVTGGTGSIGSEIVKQALKQEAAKVVVFSRDEIKHFLMRKDILSNRLETAVGDVRDLNSFEQIFRNIHFDIIYHTAAMKHLVMCEEFPLEAVKTNVLGTQNVVDLALKYNVSKVITISTDKTAYPVNILGTTKQIAEKITLNANKFTNTNQVFACVRFGNVANSRGSVIPVFMDNLFGNKPIIVSDMNVTRFILEIPDAVRLVIKATEYAKGGAIFILKMKAFKLEDLVDVIVNRIAPAYKINSANIRVEITGLVPGEKLHEKLINETEASRLFEFDDMYTILQNDDDIVRYSKISLVKAKPINYSSDCVELVSKDKIESIILKYLKKRISQ